ncbi:hypothetical protein [Sodalis-like endosymbiont of Proechinophthirus fluctus]|uniref:hypothetical protein n=1 Tax=Sodalis-like endosymbiont of Proechinophthirus fluctus TaxID=1462730 RepID=UPI0034E95A11
MCDRAEDIVRQGRVLLVPTYLAIALGCITIPTPMAVRRHSTRLVEKTFAVTLT